MINDVWICVDDPSCWWSWITRRWLGGHRLPWNEDDAFGDVERSMRWIRIVNHRCDSMRTRWRRMLSKCATTCFPSREQRRKGSFGGSYATISSFNGRVKDLENEAFSYAESCECRDGIANETRRNARATVHRRACDAERKELEFSPLPTRERERIPRTNDGFDRSSFLNDL